MSIKTSVVRNAPPCRPIDRYRCFVEICCLHFIHPEEWMQHASPKRRYIFIKLHLATSLNTAVVVISRACCRILLSSPRVTDLPCIPLCKKLVCFDTAAASLFRCNVWSVCKADGVSTKLNNKKHKNFRSHCLTMKSHDSLCQCFLSGSVWNAWVPRRENNGSSRTFY
jgi:hypothetical protein